MSVVIENDDDVADTCAKPAMIAGARTAPKLRARFTSHDVLVRLRDSAQLGQGRAPSGLASFTR